MLLKLLLLLAICAMAQKDIFRFLQDDDDLAEDDYDDDDEGDWEPGDAEDEYDDGEDDCEEEDDDGNCIEKDKSKKIDEDEVEDSGIDPDLLAIDGDDDVNEFDPAIKTAVEDSSFKAREKKTGASWDSFSPLKRRSGSRLDNALASRSGSRLDNALARRSGSRLDDALAGIGKKKEEKIETLDEMLARL